MTQVRAALRLADFRKLLVASAFTTLASRALTVVIGYQVYEISGNPFALGWLGLVEAIPALTLALFGGHVADRTDRKRIIVYTLAAASICSAGLAALARDSNNSSELPIYAVVFVIGVARGFAEPAVSAFEAQVVPRELYVSAAALQSSVWQGCAIFGPALGGIAYRQFGAKVTYELIGLLFVGGLLAVLQIRSIPFSAPKAGESIIQSIALGVRYVFRDQVLVGSMALDQFAVLFGGAIAMLPVFAKDILSIGPDKLGFLYAAPSAGALLVMLWSTRHPPVKHAGRNLMLSVAAFGVSMIIFALSENFWLSLIALTASGAFDGVSMVIRKSILRIMSPDHLRGRISAVSSIFIGSSNEIGAFESGVAAGLLGTVLSVWLGGVVTLVVVGVAAIAAPRLRRLDLTAVDTEFPVKTLPKGESGTLD
jgi:MFS family permease